MARAASVHAVSRGVAVCAALLVLLCAFTARAEPGDELPVTSDTPPPGGDPALARGADSAVLASAGGGGAEDAAVLTSPSLPSLPATDAPAPDAKGAPATSQVKDDDPRAVTDFEPRLQPYGAWVDDQKYGHVWVPDRAIVGDAFSPYATGGHWALDADDDWVWVSDYAFGDVVFHYGRWAWTSYGWAWVPGYQYAPAWVVWRVPSGPYAYVGWAPAPPSYAWWGGASVALWYAPPYYWVFCPSAYVFAPYPYGYLVTRPGYVRTLARYTRHYAVGTPRGIVRGPPPSAARIPSGAMPASRLPAGSARTAAFVGAPRPAQGLSRPAVAPTRTFDTQAWSRPSPSRTWSTPVRTFAPPARSFSPGAPVVRGPVAPSAAVAPRVWTPPPRAPTPVPPSRVYAPPARMTAPPPRAYAPPPRAYAPPRVSAPARVYSPPAWHPAPSYSRPSGGGARRR